MGDWDIAAFAYEKGSRGERWEAIRRRSHWGYETARNEYRRKYETVGPRTCICNRAEHDFISSCTRPGVSDGKATRTRIRTSACVRVCLYLWTYASSVRSAIDALNGRTCGERGCQTEARITYSGIGSAYSSAKASRTNHLWDWDRGCSWKWKWKWY